jgi:hypothetical protein
MLLLSLPDAHRRGLMATVLRQFLSVSFREVPEHFKMLQRLFRNPERLAHGPSCQLLVRLVVSVLQRRLIQSHR